MKNTFDSLYVQRCLRVAGSEVLTVEKPNFEYYFTLYYYDQEDNLVRLRNNAMLEVCRKFRVGVT